MTTKECWMQTYLGKKFKPFNAQIWDVDIRDIAHSLSNTCRFNGHCKQFYSVAQHSVLVSNIVSAEAALAALLHDAPEAYVGDTIRPLKQIDLINGYRNQVEGELLTLIHQRFSVEYSNAIRDEIQMADDILLLTELRDLMAEPPEPWDVRACPLKGRIKPLLPKDAEDLFLKRFDELREIQEKRIKK